MKFDNWSALSSSEARVDDFSERTIASSVTSEGNEEYFEDSIPPPDEPPRTSTSESRFRVSHFSESHMTSSNGTSSSSLSLFHSEVQEILLRCSGCPKNEHETIQFSSKKLFSIMKSNKNKNRMFSSDFNFSRTSRIIIESEDIDVAPCPPAHLFLSRDQVRLLEENVRNQSPSKSKATLENKITSLYSISLEPLVQNQDSATVDISPQAQASFSRQTAPQSQGFSKAQFTGETHQFFNNQASVNRQPESEARYFALPQDLVREPLSSSTQDSFQTLDMDRSQHLVQVPQSVETRDSVKGLGSDTRHSDEAQDSVSSEGSNKIKYSIPGQDTILKDARHLVLPPSPSSVAKVMPQLEHVKTEGQKQIASSTLNQPPAYGSLPLMTRQKNRRKRSRSKSELSLKDPPQKSKKTPASQVFHTTACHTAECRHLRYEHKTKKKELHQRKGVSGIALHFTYAFKLVPPYIRKYSRKRQAKFTPGLTECRDFLPKPDQSLCAEKVNYVGSVEEKGTTGSTENEEQHGRNNKELENISQEIPSQLEQSFMVNTCPHKVPCPPLIETNWMNKESLEDPKEMDMTESCAPNSETTSDLPVARQETPLEEAISEPLKKCVSSPQMKLDRNMKTWEDLRGTENSNPALSSREELPTSVSEMQRCVSQGNTDRKDLEIVLESSDINMFVSLGAKKHKSSGQPAGVEIQERPEDVTEKEKKALRVHVTEEDDVSGSEELECSASSSINNMQDESVSAVFHEATHTALSLPPRLTMQSRLKTKMDTSEIEFSFSAVKPDELPDNREMYFSFEKNCLVKKPQEDNREEEQQAPQEAASQLTPGFRFSLRLQQKPTYVKLELGQSSSKGQTTQNEELNIHPQTVSTETTVGTSQCPTMDPFQGEVKQSADRPTGRETADPVHPLTMFESLPVLTESTGCGVPLGGSPEKSLDAQIAEEKQDLEGVLPEVALGSFHRHMPPLSNLKRKKIRKKITGTTNVLGLKCVIMKVKKPPKCHRRRLRSNFKVIIKHILQDKTTADTLLNVIDPRLSILPHVRMHSRLNVGNHSHTELKQETSEAEREDDYSAIINKGRDSGNSLEAARLQGDVSGDQEASPEAVLEDRWNRSLDEDPEKELKSMKEMQQLMTFAEIMAESILMATTDSVHIENMEKSLTAPTDLRCTADDSEMSPPTSEKSLIGDPLNHTRESDVPDDGSDTRETSYCFAAMKAERPEDLPAVFPKTFNCHMPVLSHSKVKKTRVRSSPIECRVNSKSVPMKTLKPSISQMCNITGHQRKKLKSEFKAKFEKVGQVNGLEYEYLNTLHSPVHSRLQGETKSFCHVQAKLWGLAIEERPLYVDFFDESNALCDREEKVQDTEEKKQKTLQITAPQHTQYLWINGYGGKETHLAEPDAGLHRLTQEQDTQHQTCFKQAALQTDVQVGPREAEELPKTNKPEDDLTAPAGCLFCQTPK
ncbi:leucine-rich repeat transmembrane protein CCDC168-like [Dama dama]|uniref:leucine-rich repeat transmembrane protein CCDC168-like n=1 Tax=Dama dama TaxID=30532 RepID=UPI002A366D63|nr:leucine-rich repeat transmembrane protein CCDC168-like [Dama dama]